MILRTCTIAAACGLAAPAFAGVSFGPSISRMLIGNGFVDVEAADPWGYTDSALIDSPPVGSTLIMGGIVPGVGDFFAELSFSDEDADRAVFSFSSGVNAVAFGGSGYEFAMSGNRVTFSTETELLVTLRGDLLTEGGGLAGFNVLNGSASPVFFSDDGIVEHSILLGPGVHTIGWGALVNPLGGATGFEGTVSFVAVPAPGSAALLIAASLVTGRRRRR
jgi:hypothetical protein